MSTRGVDFLHSWMIENFAPEIVSDRATAQKLAESALSAANAEGIPNGEMEEDIGSVEAVILVALLNRDPCDASLGKR